MEFLTGRRGLETEDYNSVLEALKEERICKFKVKGNLVLVSEQCDEYFSVRLTKNQVLTLADELKDIAQSIKE